MRYLEIDSKCMTKFVISIILFEYIVFGKPFVPCLMGSDDKCLANSTDMTAYSRPNDSSVLIYAKTQPNSSVCFNLCSENKICFMAAYRSDNKTCLMYETISYTNIIENTYLLYFWRCCNTNISNTVKNRCPGFWKYKPEYLSFNSMRKNDFLVSFANVELFICQMKCLDNPICGSINILAITGSTNVTCELILQFPVENIKMKSHSGSDTYIWQCASNYTLPIPNTECVPRFKDGAGYWVIQNTSIPMYNNLKTVMYFHTYNYQACLNNCMMYRHCKRAWYSLESLFCMLESDELSTCADIQAANNYNFTTYIWKQCSSEINSQYHLNIQQRSCRKIKNNQYMYILSTKCGHLPSNKKHLFLCSTPTIHGTPPPYSENFHCQNNQSFQVIGKLEEHISELGEFADLIWMRVFTGYESFWLANVSDSNFPQIENSICDVYNADMNVDNENDLKIIQRKQWFAKKPKGAENPYPKFPVPFVIITDTERPYCGCFTEEACSYQMRVIQDILVDYVFIPYNFIVTGDGMVYIGKGWEFENKATGGAYNSLSVSIAICGRYILEPEIESLNTVKKIIKLGIREKKISENYTLYLLRDIGIHSQPAEGLSRVIELWPRYRGYQKYGCSSLRENIIFMNMITSLIMFGLIVLFIHIYIKPLKHQAHCQFIKNCQITSIYVTHDDEKLKKIPKFYIHHINNLHNEDMYISPFTSQIIWIEDKVEIYISDQPITPCQCQTAVFAFFNLCRFQSSLINMRSVIIIPELSLCSKFTAFSFEINLELSIRSLLILHSSSIEYCSIFIDKINSNKCVCTTYNLVQYQPKTGCFTAGHRCDRDLHSTEIKNYSSRSEMETLYSFLFDEKDSLCFYRE